MELKPLESFLAVISTGSITGAARVLLRSQPVVTRHIQELEGEIGFELFRRNGPRISPTERGLRFHAEVERLIMGLRQLTERAEAIGDATPLAIEIAAIPALAAGLVPAALGLLDPALRPRNIHLRSAPAEQVVQSVLARNADIGISSMPLDHPGVDLHRLYQAACVIAVPQNHALAEKACIDLADLDQQTIIGMANPFRLRHRVDMTLADAGIVPAMVIDTNSTVNALQLARQGVGIGIVEPVTALGVPMQGVAIRPLLVEIPFVWGLVTAQNAPLSPTVQRLIEHLDTVCRELLPDVTIIDAGDRERLDHALYGARKSNGTDNS